MKLGALFSEFVLNMVLLAAAIVVLIWALYGEWKDRRECKKQTAWLKEFQRRNK